MYDLSSGGLPLGRIAGIRISVHWFLLIWWVFDLQDMMRVQDGDGRSQRLAWWAIGTLITFLSILLHELGHCFAARRVGGYADHILMWPLGGLAFCQCPDTWRAHLIVAAGGPAVTAAIVGLGYPAFALAAYWRPDLLHHEMYYAAKGYVVDWNLLILIFNLIPLYPLDGGRIFHALAWRHHARKTGWLGSGPGRANWITFQVSRVTAVGVILYALYKRDIFVGLIGLWAFTEAQRLQEDRW